MNRSTPERQQMLDDRETLFREQIARALRGLAGSLSKDDFWCHWLMTRTHGSEDWDDMCDQLIELGTVRQATARLEGEHREQS